MSRVVSRADLDDHRPSSSRMVIFQYDRGRFQCPRGTPSLKDLDSTPPLVANAISVIHFVYLKLKRREIPRASNGFVGIKLTTFVF